MNLASTGRRLRKFCNNMSGEIEETPGIVESLRQAALWSGLFAEHTARSGTMRPRLEFWCAAVAPRLSWTLPASRGCSFMERSNHSTRSRARTNWLPPPRIVACAAFCWAVIPMKALNCHRRPQPFQIALQYSVSALDLAAWPISRQSCDSPQLHGWGVIGRSESLLAILLAQQREWDEPTFPIGGEAFSHFSAASFSECQLRSRIHQDASSRRARTYLL
jgi:hypothetical protein